MTDEIFEDVTKVTVYLNAESMSALYGLAAELGISRTDAMNQALQGYQALLHLDAGWSMDLALPGGERRAFQRTR